MLEKLEFATEIKILLKNSYHEKSFSSENQAHNIATHRKTKNEIKHRRWDYIFKFTVSPH